MLSFLPISAGLKKLNDWPTFPQIIANGELIGGLDILKVSKHVLCTTLVDKKKLTSFRSGTY